MGKERPFYFIVSFWGREFRELFLRLCAASLLSPGNIPALAHHRSSRFLICTTPEDWCAISTDPIFQTLQSYTEPLFIHLRHTIPSFLKPVVKEKLRQSRKSESPTESMEEMQVSPMDIATDEAFAELQIIGQRIGIKLSVHHRYALRILFMSAGHRAAACRAHADGAYAVFLAPDMVLSDGSVAHLAHLARQGNKVVLVPACRFNLDESVAAFQKRGLMQPGVPLVLPPRLLVQIAFANMHPETACFEFDSPYFCDTATSAFWRVPGDAGVLLYSFFWAPLLVSLGDVPVHRAEYFDNGGTTDGKYIAMHFDPRHDVTVVADSDEIFLASFSRGSEYYYPIKSGILKRLPGISNWYKSHLIRTSLHGPMGDVGKRHFYTMPMRLHTEPVSPAWEVVEREAAPCVARAAREPKGLARVLVFSTEFRRRLRGEGITGLSWYLLNSMVRRLPDPRRQQLKAWIRKAGFARSA